MKGKGVIGSCLLQEELKNLGHLWILMLGANLAIFLFFFFCYSKSFPPKWRRSGGRRKQSAKGQMVRPRVALLSSCASPEYQYLRSIAATHFTDPEGMAGWVDPTGTGPGRVSHPIRTGLELAPGCVGSEGTCTSLSGKGVAAKSLDWEW